MALRGARVVQRLPCPSVRATAESVPDVRGPITLGTKRTGKPGAGGPHAGFDEAGAGDGLTAGLVRHSQRKRGATDRPDLRGTAPVLDPTGGGRMEKVSWPVDRHCRSKRTAKRSPAQTENLASRLPYSKNPGLGERVEAFLLRVFTAPEAGRGTVR